MRLHEQYEVVRPGCCNNSFALPKRTIDNLKAKRKGWFCPHCGASRIFTGETEEQRRARLAEQRCASEEACRIEAETLAAQRGRQYRRIRERVQAGVCPCCNRTFQNLARHMATKHPKLKRHERLRHLRHQFGLTQADLAIELFEDAGKAGYVSRFENDHAYVPAWACERIAEWLGENA